MYIMGFYDFFFVHLCTKERVSVYISSWLHYKLTFTNNKEKYITKYIIVIVID